MRLFAGKSTLAITRALGLAALVGATPAGAQQATVPLPKVIAPGATTAATTPPEQSTVPAPSRVAASPVPVTRGGATTAASTYGPIQPGESLSTVAIAMSEQSGIHVAQVMWALYAASPEAFKGSINQLRVGATLSVPPAAEMTAVSIRQARINIRDAALAPVATESSKPAADDTVKVPTPNPVPTVALEPVPGVAAPLPTVALDPTPAASAAPRATTPDTQEPRVVELPATDTAATADTPAATTQPPAVTAAPVAASADTPVVTEPATAPTTAVEAPAEKDAAPLTGRQLVLPFIALAGFIIAILLGNRRKRREREEQRAVEQEAAMRKRSELADLARGEFIAEPGADAPDSEAAVSAPQPAPEVAADDPTLVMPIADVPPVAEKPAQTPGADPEDPNFESFDDGINAGDDIDSALDLARGYADMGEIDRARSLLNMVMSRGNPSQQAEAKEVLESLP